MITYKKLAEEKGENSFFGISCLKKKYVQNIRVFSKISFRLIYRTFSYLINLVLYKESGEQHLVCLLRS